MRHCMIVHSYYPHDETRVERQAESLIKAGCSVDVICLREGNEPATVQVAGITVHRLPIERDKKRGALGQLFEYLSFMVLAAVCVTRLHLQERFQTVQVHNLPDFLVFAALLPRLTGARIVLDLHDLMPEFYCARFATTMDSLPVRLIKWQEALACQFAHRVITVTELWRDTLIARGVPPEKISVVMNVADTRYFRSLPGARTEHTPLHLIYHGTLTYRYGIDLILRALGGLREQFADVRLTIHGRGEYLQDLNALVQELRLQDQVHISTGFLTSAALADLVRAHDIGIVPYRRDIFTDGILPTKLMEYTALGMPALVARTPCISQYFDDSQVEYFEAENAHDLAEHLSRLCDDPQRRRTLAANTYKFNEKYNWTRQGEIYTLLIRTLASQNAPPRTETNLVSDPLNNEPL